jgi:hypothetical protein
LKITKSLGKSKHRPVNDKKLFGGIYPFIQTGEVKAQNIIAEYNQTYNEIGLSQSKICPGRKNYQMQLLLTSCYKMIRVDGDLVLRYILLIFADIVIILFYFFLILIVVLDSFIVKITHSAQEDCENFSNNYLNNLFC